MSPAVAVPPIDKLLFGVADCPTATVSVTTASGSSVSRHILNHRYIISVGRSVEAGGCADA